MSMPAFQAIGAFALYFVLGLGFVALFLAVFLRATPHAEIRLIREGNVAAAVGLAGALVGFCLPLSMALRQAGSVTDLAIWAVVALLGQVAAHGFVRLLLSGFPQRIERGDLAAAITSASLHLGIGLLNAAAMTV
jgi:putative membrane protein